MRILDDIRALPGEKIYCAEYLRYSSYLQNDTSIERQQSVNRRITEPLGMEILENHIYIDRETKGTLANREALDELLKIARSEKPPFRYIIIYDTSRLSRALLKAPQICIELAFRGIYVYFSNDGIDTSDKDEFIKVAYRSIEDYRSNEKLSIDVYNSMEERVRNGFHGGGRKYGYKSVPSEIQSNGKPIGRALILYEEEARTIRLIFWLYGKKGWSIKKICNLLNKQYQKKGTHKPAGGKHWQLQVVSRILENEIYIGITKWNVHTYEKNLMSGEEKKILNPETKWVINHKNELRIISDELWNKVQEIHGIVKKNCKGKSFMKARRFYSRHLLTSLTHCAECQGTFSVTSGGPKYPKYGCSVYQNTGSSRCTNSLKINKAFLEEIVISQLIKEFSDINKTELVLREVRQNLAVLIKDKLNETLQKRINSLDKNIEHILTVIKEGQVAATDSKLVLMELSNLDKLKEELKNQLLQECPELPPDVITLTDLRLFFLKIVEDLGNPKNAKEALTSVVQSISIQPLGEGAVGVKITENTDKTNSYLLSLASSRDSGIQYVTLKGYVLYTTRTFELTFQNLRKKRGQNAH